MAQLILFGGGDGGGIYITASGIHHIPPFNPDLRLQLKGLSALINGIAKMQTRERQEMTTLVNRMTNLVIVQIESVIGSLEGNNSLIYMDGDGGFCGTPPIPIFGPPRHLPELSELIANGVLKRDLIDFSTLISNEKLNILEVFENPMKVANEIGFSLSERSASYLHKLALSQLRNITDPVDKEVINFFHSVLEDRRYIETWMLQPFEVANNLKIKLSDQALYRIIAGSNPMPGLTNPIALSIVAGVINMLVPAEVGHEQLLIEDYSEN